MITLLFSLQWILAITVSGIVLFKAWQITRVPVLQPEALNREAVVTQGRRLMSGLYPLRVLPSVAMTLGMLVAMLDLAQALQGLDQNQALQHAFVAIGLAMATAAVGMGAGSWLRAKTGRRLEQLQRLPRADAEISTGSS